MQFYVQVSYNGKGVVVTGLRCDLVPARSELTIDLTLNTYYTLHTTHYMLHATRYTLHYTQAMVSCLWNPTQSTELLCMSIK
jgi:hypothetical protein